MSETTSAAEVEIVGEADHIPEGQGAMAMRLPLSHPVFSPPAPPSFAEMILDIARDPNVSVEKLQALVAMRDAAEDRARRLAREDAEEAARRVFDEAMAAAQAEIPIVIKNRYNETTKSDFADLAAVADAVHPVITKHGFSLSFWPCESAKAGHFGLAWRLAHVGGFAREGVADMPSTALGPKGSPVMTDMHAFGSASSYGRRYLELSLFNVATGLRDDDGNAAGLPETDTPITAEQFQELQRLVDDAQPDMALFLQHLKVERLEHLRQSGLQRAHVALRAKIKQRNAAAAAAGKDADRG
jgi:hypothetical protein